MGETEVRLTKLAKCAGCGAKVGAGTLAALLGDLPTRRDDALLVGYDRSDDACVYKVSSELALVQTIDFFPPMTDDPFLFGQIAAANALSDVYAMGGEPKLALNLLCVPENMAEASVKKILAGGYDKVFEAGAVIAGGHSIYDDEPKYGLSVTGYVHPDRVLKNCGARAGDMLILTKPLGVGILTTAKKAGMLNDEAEARVLRQMALLNRSARDCIVSYRVHACTDVTGFALLGHLLEMMQGSETSAILETDAVAFLPDTLMLADMGLIPAGAYRNRAFAEPFVFAEKSVPLCMQDALYDPQTSGGLLVSVDPNDKNELLADLTACGLSARCIGRVTGRDGKAIRLV